MHDRATGLGWAGGYVGTGVTATNLAGRTLADLVLGRDTDAHPGSPWVGHRAKRWEIEPLRWTRRQRDLHRLPAWPTGPRPSAPSDRTAWPAHVADWVAGRH